MKARTLEIAWHETAPIWSADISPTNRLVTAGGDKVARVWQLPCSPLSSSPSPSPSLSPSPSPSLSLSPSPSSPILWLCDLRAHLTTVNVARFSRSGHRIATAADQGEIVIWARDAAPLLPSPLDSDDTPQPRERWARQVTLRGHVQDVLDVAWGVDGFTLASASVDNAVMVWDVRAPAKAPVVIRAHANFVQGVAIDPWGKLIASLGNDRTMRVFARGSGGGGGVWAQQAIVSAITKEEKLFVDDTKFKTFFRRLAFSPDGSVLACPSGLQFGGEGGAKGFAVHLFARGEWAQPAVQCAGLDKPACAVRFSPILYALRCGRQCGDRKPDVSVESASIQGGGESAGEKREESVFDGFAYRMIFAVACMDCVLFYDTEAFSRPFAKVEGLHCAELTDLAWSADGLSLVLSSVDGYASLISFAPEELGLRLSKEKTPHWLREYCVPKEAEAAEVEVPAENRVYTKTIRVTATPVLPVAARSKPVVVAPLQVRSDGAVIRNSPNRSPTIRVDGVRTPEKAPSVSGLLKTGFNAPSVTQLPRNASEAEVGRGVLTVNRLEPHQVLASEEADGKMDSGVGTGGRPLSNTTTLRNTNGQGFRITLSEPKSAEDGQPKKQSERIVEKSVTTDTTVTPTDSIIEQKRLPSAMVKPSSNTRLKLTATAELHSTSPKTQQAESVAAAPSATARPDQRPNSKLEQPARKKVQLSPSSPLKQPTTARSAELPVVGQNQCEGQMAVARLMQPLVARPVQPLAVKPLEPLVSTTTEPLVARTVHPSVAGAVQFSATQPAKPPSVYPAKPLTVRPTQLSSAEPAQSSIAKATILPTVKPTLLLTAKLTESSAANTLNPSPVKPSDLSSPKSIPSTEARPRPPSPSGLTPIPSLPVELAQLSSAKPAQPSNAKPIQLSATASAQPLIAKSTQLPVAKSTEPSIFPLTRLSDARPAQPSAPKPTESPILKPTQPSNTSPTQVSTARPTQQSTAKPMQPLIAKPRELSTGGSTQPATTRPSQPTTATSAHPSTARPAHPASAERTEPVTVKSIQPSTANLTQRSTVDPPQCQAASPMQPPATRLVDDAFIKPAEHVTVRTEAESDATLLQCSVTRVVQASIAKPVHPPTCTQHQFGSGKPPQASSNKLNQPSGATLDVAATEVGQYTCIRARSMAPASQAGSLSKSIESAARKGVATAVHPQTPPRQALAQLSSPQPALPQPPTLTAASDVTTWTPKQCAKLASKVQTILSSPPSQTANSMSPVTDPQRSTPASTGLLADVAGPAAAATPKRRARAGMIQMVFKKKEGNGADSELGVPNREVQVGMEEEPQSKRRKVRDGIVVDLT